MRKLTALVIAGGLFGSVVVQREAAAEDPCGAWDVEYALSGTIAIRDTRMGAGDGDHAVGPGALVLRFESGEPGPGPVKMVSYTMKSFFTVEAKALVWNTKVITDTQTTTASACGVAEGVLAKTRLGWTGRSVHTRPKERSRARARCAESSVRRSRERASTSHPRRTSRSPPSTCPPI